MPRRKKKPLYRPRNIFLTLVALAAIAIGRQVYLALTAKPGQAVNYAGLVAELIQKYQPASVTPDSPNGFELLNEAIAVESQVQTDIRARYPMQNGQYPIDYSTLLGPYVDGRSYNGALPEIQEHTREAIAALQTTEVFDLMDKVAASPRAIRPTPQGHLIDMLLPNLGKYRNFARLNAARMYLAGVSGDDAERVRAFEQSLAIARVAAHGSFVIEQLVGIAIDALALGELTSEIVDRPPSEDTALALLAAIDRQPLPSMRLSMEGERLGVLDAIQWTHTDDGRGSGRLIPSTVSQFGAGMGSGSSSFDKLSQWRIFNLGGAAFPSKAANIRKAEELFKIIFDATDKPYFERKTGGIQMDQFVQTLPRRYVVLQNMLPALGKSLQSRDQVDTLIAGVRIMLALEVFKHRAGHYPASLEELSPGILSALPKDPFTGRNFGYRLLKPDEDPDHRRYTLYSFGADQVDNLGNSNPKNPYVALRLPNGRGYDLLINPARQKPDQPEPDPTPANPDGPAPPVGPPSPTQP